MTLEWLTAISVYIGDCDGWNWAFKRTVLIASRRNWLAPNDTTAAEYLIKLGARSLPNVMLTLWPGHLPPYAPVINTDDTELVNTLRPNQNGRYIAHNIFKCIASNENCCSWITKMNCCSWRPIWQIVNRPRWAPLTNWAKWTPFRRRYFQIHFREWNILHFDKKIHGSLFLRV